MIGTIFVFPLLGFFSEFFFFSFPLEDVDKPSILYSIFRFWFLRFNVSFKEKIGISLPYLKRPINSHTINFHIILFFNCVNNNVNYVLFNHNILNFLVFFSYINLYILSAFRMIWILIHWTKKNNNNDSMYTHTDYHFFNVNESSDIIGNW